MAKNRFLDIVHSGRTEDNRYVITNLIQCQQDTPRVVPAAGEVDVFALQEKVIASIIQSSVEQVAVEEARKLLDPIQQTVITTLRRYINSPTVSRKAIVEAVQKLNEPQPSVYVKTLRKAYETFATDGNVEALLGSVGALEAPTDSSLSNKGAGENGDAARRSAVKRQDLRLICFDYLWQ